jgi:hypothetical protein
MKKGFMFLAMMAMSFHLKGQTNESDNYWQVKVDFLEPLINQSVVLRFDKGIHRHLFGLVGGFGGRISEYDNEQYATYQDKINYRLGVEYQYFLSRSKVNRGFYIGGDLDYSSHTIESKVTDESVKNIAVFTPGLWFGWMWKPFKNADFYIDLTIAHPRYSFGDIEKVEFNTVAKPYQPKNLFNFLGPWSIGWRF